MGRHARAPVLRLLVPGSARGRLAMLTSSLPQTLVVEQDSVGRWVPAPKQSGSWSDRRLCVVNFSYFVYSYETLVAGFTDFELNKIILIFLILLFNILRL